MKKELQMELDNTIKKIKEAGYGIDVDNKVYQLNEEVLVIEETAYYEGEFEMQGSYQEISLLHKINKELFDSFEMIKNIKNKEIRQEKVYTLLESLKPYKSKYDLRLKGNIFNWDMHEKNISTRITDDVLTIDCNRGSNSGSLRIYVCTLAEYYKFEQIEEERDV